MRNVNCRKFVVVIVLLFFCFRPAWATDPEFRFVVFGDNQQSVKSAASGVPERLAVPRVIASLNPDFVLSVGDLMDRGEAPGAYDKLAEYQAPFMDRVPFFPTLGNHDANGIGAYKKFLDKQLSEVNPRVCGKEKYAKDFIVCPSDDKIPSAKGFRDPECAKYKKEIPSGVNFRTHYAFQFRNAYFISMEVGTRWWSNTPFAWLEKELKQASENPAIEHVFVYLHHPVYSSGMADQPPDPKHPGRGECMKPVRDAYEPLFRKYKVLMVFSGHIHNYEHLLVPGDKHPTAIPAGQPRRREYLPGEGIHYLVTGGGGGLLGGIGGWSLPSRNYRQYGETGYHILLVDVSGKTVQVKCLVVTGGEKDFSSKITDEFIVGP